MTEKSATSRLDLVRAHSLTSVLREEILALILKGDLAPGQRINESDLSSRFQVSRGPIREALQALGAQGWIQFARNRGAYVQSFTLEEARERYELRGALEETIGRRLARSATKDQLNELRARLRELDALTKEDQIEHYYPVNLDFHEKMAAMAGNQRLLDIYLQLGRELHLMRRQSLTMGEGLHFSNDEHWEIVDAIASGDEERAARAMRSHITQSYNRLTHARDGETDAPQAQPAPRKSAAAKTARKSMAKRSTEETS